jgi:hypothetical protein
MRTAAHEYIYVPGGALETVHIFISTARFHSFEEMREFIDETYTKDGDGVPSPFMREVGLTHYEPDCIEAVHKAQPVGLTELLAGASYEDQWIAKLDRQLVADSAICVFAPNRLNHPTRSSLEYVGAFDYVVK